MSPSLNVRTRASESRVRSGCWKCRERRVKCPEQRPVCRHCERLGYSCRYEIRLTWKSVHKSHGRSSYLLSAGACHPGWTSYDVVVDDWMFLNTTYDDFDTSLPDGCETTPESIPSHSPCPSTNSDPGVSPTLSMSSATLSMFSSSSSSPSRMSVCSLSPRWSSHPLDRTLDSPKMPSPYHLSPFSLLPNEARLWNYFMHFIAPRCALVENPWLDVLLRLAVFTPRKSLFDCIMAVSANQMQILGHGESAVSALSLRNKALRSLRSHIAHYESSADCDVTADQLSLREETADQIMCSTVLMCFFDVSLDCLQSWKVHADFACRFVSAQVAKRQKHGSLSSALVFVSAYFASHHVLACAGDFPRLPKDMFRHLQYLTDSSMMQTMTGCPRWLMDLISEITDLAMHPEVASLESMQPPPPPTSSLESPQSTIGTTLQGRRPPLPHDLQRRRDDIERRIHEHALYPESYTSYIYDDSTYGGGGGGDSGELGGRAHDDSADMLGTSVASLPCLSGNEDEDLRRIVETKRLVTLMYLYSRIDHSSPYKPHMMRLTSRIMELLPSISTYTTCLLWPLFIVATLGVRPEAEEERRIVLGRLEELLQSRQLGHVRKAREIIVDVWKARDLRPSDAVKSWSILNGRLDTISLA